MYIHSAIRIFGSLSVVSDVVVFRDIAVVSVGPAHGPVAVRVSLCEDGCFTVEYFRVRSIVPCSVVLVAA